MHKIGYNFIKTIEVFCIFSCVEKYILIGDSVGVDRQHTESRQDNGERMSGEVVFFLFENPPRCIFMWIPVVLEVYTWKQ